MITEIDPSYWYVLYNIVFKKIELFERDYKCRPRYIKLPEYFYKEILRCNNDWIVVEKQSGVTLFGLKVCPTVSIERLEDIDVFLNGARVEMKEGKPPHYNQIK